MAESIGAIQLDLTVNDRGYKKQINGLKEQAKKTASDMSSAFNGAKGSLNGIGNIAKKTAGLLAGAFAVKKIVDFGKECLELGSDLAEVQNVVDVAFPTMSAQVDKFAKKAAFSFGLSETMAKKFSGTFGSMAKAFGFTEKESAKMATALTGLAGDVASFYNISQDEAYTKLKSVFTGETESLKDLGVVMTQTALDSFALANGFGKTTKKMSELEKVSLRYAFVQSQLTDAAGDFSRTSDSWANQVRILSLQFDSLRANIGQGLINVFSPVIKLINTLMGRLVTLADAFKSFTEILTGKKSDDGTAKTAEGANAAAGALGTASKSAKSLKEQTKAAGKEAKKTAKELLGIAGFDELNLFTSNKSDSDKDSDKASSGSPIGGSIDIGKTPDADKDLKKIDSALKAILDSGKKVSALFLKGFKIGLGDTSVLESIKKELKSIQKSIGEIFSDSKLQAAIKKWIASLILNFGKVVGSVASIGLTIADNLLGGIDKYLKQHKKDIIKDLTAIFDITANISDIIGNFSTVLAEIATVFRSDKAKQITADLINIFADTVLNMVLLGQKIAYSLISNITKPIIENKEKIKKALENTIKPLSTVINSISTYVSKTWDKIQSIYDTKVAPLIDSLGDGISGWMGTFLDGYNTYIAPVLTKISEQFKSVMEEHVQPAVDTVLDAIGDFCDMLKTLWEKRLQPLGNWIIKNLVPIFSVLLKNAADKVMVVIKGLAAMIKNLATVFSAVCKVIKAAVNGDWKAVWEEIKALFKHGWEFIKKVFEPVGGFFKKIGDIIKSAFSFVTGYFKSTFEGAYKKVTGAFSGAKKAFDTVAGKVKEPFAAIGSWFKTTFDGAYKKVTGAFSGVKKAFNTVWSTIKAPFANVADWFKDKFSRAWQAVKDVFSSGGKIFSGIKDGIADTFKKVVNCLISGINTIIKKPFDAINGMLNQIRDVGVAGVKPFKGLWDKNPLTVPKIPALANGGYVKANTPTLAMIGDNRHYGEITSPENKLQSMADNAASMAGEVTAKALIPVLERLCNSIIELENSQGNTVRLEGITESGLYRIVKTEHRKERKRKGEAGYVL